jgi:hypothetical protein
MPVYLQLEGETGFPHEGVIDFVDNTYNASTGTLQIRGRFKNGLHAGGVGLVHATHSTQRRGSAKPAPRKCAQTCV